MESTVTIKKDNVWNAIWQAKQLSGGQKLVAFLRALLPSPSPRSSKGTKKLAFVVGHNEYDKGALAPEPLLISEHPFNKKIGLRDGLPRTA